MHFPFNVLRINGFYMFQALLAYPQEVLYKRHLVYCVACYVSWLYPTKRVGTMRNFVCFC
jgi:hypothetical protein